MTTSISPLAIVLAGGHGSRLHELTSNTCKPAVPFGGPWRIIDWTMANLLRSSIDRTIVAMQYKPKALVRHIDTVWSRHFGKRSVTQIHGPTLTGDDTGFRGTADALRRILSSTPASNAEIIVLGADHIYDMDYDAMIAAHRTSGASATVAAFVVPRKTAGEFGVISTNASGRVTEFLEKPAQPPGLPDDPENTLVSMGVYVFDQTWLRDMLRRHGDALDIGHDLLPMARAEGSLFAHRGTRIDGRPFYWRDVGSLDTFREAHCDYIRNRPCSVPVGASGAVRSCLQSERRNAILAGAWISPRARLTDTIVAPNTRITDSIVIGEDPEEDARWFRVTPGGTRLVTAAMLARHAEARNRSYILAGRSFLGATAVERRR
ncbi:MAG: sugar phosphate nucleotidyltransferase [Paracoccaceae bacterium]